jgi:hypothetical protein
MNPPLPDPPPAGVNIRPLTSMAQFGGLHADINDVSALGIEVAPGVPPVAWRLRMRGPGGDLVVDPGTGEMEVSDLVMVLGYDWD